MAWLQKIEYEAPVCPSDVRFYEVLRGPGRRSFYSVHIPLIVPSPLQPHHTTNTARCVAHWDAKKTSVSIALFQQFFFQPSVSSPRLKFSTPLVKSGSFYIPFNQSNNRPLHSHTTTTTTACYIIAHWDAKTRPFPFRLFSTTFFH